MFRHLEYCVLDKCFFCVVKKTPAPFLNFLCVDVIYMDSQNSMMDQILPKLYHLIH